MAATKISGLVADNSPTSDDLIPTVNDPGGTPASKKVTLANAITKAHGLSDGIVKVSSSVMAPATAGTDYYAPGATDVAVLDGGTGASTAAGARTNLGLAIGTDVAANSHTHAAADVASGTIATARLGSGSATSGTYLRGDQTWAVVSAGQSVVTRIVAAAGGDHTTLGAAITAASSGDTIWIRNGTYTESAITSATTKLTIIGESREGVIIDLGTTTCALSGIDLTLKNLKVITSTGTMTLSGANAHVDGIDIVTSGGSSPLTMSGANSKLVNSYYLDGSTSYTTASKITISGIHSLVSNCFFSSKLQAGALAKPTVLLGASHIAVSGCTFKQTASGTNGTHLGGNSSALYCSVTGCTFLLDSASADCGVGLSSCTNWNITGNNFKDAWYSIYVSAGGYNTISGNSIYTQQAGSAIDMASPSNVVSGNVIRSIAGGGNGICCEGATADYNVITGNYVTGCNNAIYINDTAAIENVVIGNQLTGNTTPINNASVTTRISGNTFTDPTVEKTSYYMKNTSGGALAIGNVVTLKAVAAGNEVTTTTTAGDNKVFGVSQEAPANNAFGNVITAGKVTTLKVNGTTAIAVGDLLSCYTVAGIAAKASAGHMAFAIALEAYAVADSNGVLDALVITPRLV